MSQKHLEYSQTFSLDIPNESFKESFDDFEEDVTKNHLPNFPKEDIANFLDWFDDFAKKCDKDIPDEDIKKEIRELEEEFIRITRIVYS